VFRAINDTADASCKTRDDDATETRALGWFAVMRLLLRASSMRSQQPALAWQLLTWWRRQLALAASTTTSVSTPTSSTPTSLSSTSFSATVSFASSPSSPLLLAPLQPDHVFRILLACQVDPLRTTPAQVDAAADTLCALHDQLGGTPEACFQFYARAEQAAAVAAAMARAKSSAASASTDTENTTDGLAAEGAVAAISTTVRRVSDDAPTVDDIWLRLHAHVRRASAAIDAEAQRPAMLPALWRRYMQRTLTQLIGAHQWMGRQASLPQRIVMLAAQYGVDPAV
jgi:hypothetical protein